MLALIEPFFDSESGSLSKLEGDVAKHALASLVTVITEAAKTDADAQTLAYVRPPMIGVFSSYIN